MTLPRREYKIVGRELVETWLDEVAEDGRVEVVCTLEELDERIAELQRQRDNLNTHLAECADEAWQEAYYGGDAPQECYERNLGKP